MISLKEFASAMKPETRLFVDDRSKVGAAIETTSGNVWLELATTGRDFDVEHITPRPDYVLLTVSPRERD